MAKKVIAPVSYEAIIEGMLRGQGIEEQLEVFGIPKNVKCGNRRAVLLKIQKVYNVMAIVSEHGYYDPDLIRLPVPQDEFKRIAMIIGEEEERLKLKAAC